MYVMWECSQTVIHLFKNRTLNGISVDYLLRRPKPFLEFFFSKALPQTFIASENFTPFGFRGIKKRFRYEIRSASIFGSRKQEIQGDKNPFPKSFCRWINIPSVFLNMPLCVVLWLTKQVELICGLETILDEKNQVFGQELHKTQKVME